MRRAKAAKLALNIIMHNRLRSWLTIIGIVIGVAAVVSIISIGEGLQASVTRNLGGLGADILTVNPGGGFARQGFREFEAGGPSQAGSSGNLTEKDMQTLRSVENIAAMDGEVSGRAEVYYLGEKATLSVQGVDPLAWSRITTSQLESGRFLGPSDYNVVVVGSRVAGQTFKETLALNRMITIEGKSFKIVGILKQGGGVGGSDNSIIMPIEAARDTLDISKNNFNSIVIKAGSKDAVDQVLADADQRLMLSRHVTERTKDYSITSATSMQETLSSVTQTMTLFLGAIAAVSLLVGAVGIANSMFTSVMEKTKEIGIMKAIGAKNGDILMIFMLSSAMIGLVGGLAGIAVGAVISFVLPELGINIMRLPGSSGSVTTAITPSLLVYSLLLSVAVGIISGMVPSYRASKLNPVEALRYE